jgi:chemotaxis receptor (MCP) glutamine deamidase CheD
VLPNSIGHRDADRCPAKFMDLALNEIIENATEMRSRLRALKFVAVGGADVFRFGQANSGLDTRIGQRNIRALQAELHRHSLTLEAEHLGGPAAFSTYLCVQTGRVFVANNVREFELLCNLKGGHVGTVAA